MIHIKNAKEIIKMRESNRIIALVLNTLQEYIKPGVSTMKLDEIAEAVIRGEGATPAFKGYAVPGAPPFPGSICASINSVIVHGIPSKKNILQEGDIIGVDVGTFKNGFYGDGARTFAVGDISELTKKLMKITEKSLYKGIEQAIKGNRIGDISFAIGSYVIDNGFYVADNLTGHGIGRALHEEPTIMNIGIAGRGPRLKKGMTIAIEPMVNIGTNRIKENAIGEFKVADNSLSAHFEHTILITDDKPEILTKI